MFNLTSKKYLFFAISLVVLVPGIVSLLINHLNTGIDFTGGTTVDLIFQQKLDANGTKILTNAFNSQAGAKDLKIYLSTEVGSQNSQIFWVQTSIPIDSKAQADLLSRLQNDPNNATLFGTVVAKPPLAQVPGKDGAYSLIPFQFTPAPKQNNGGPSFKVTKDSILKVLSAGTLTTGPVVATTGVTAATTPTPATSPTAAPTAKPAGTATPAAGTATPTPTTPQTTPYKIVSVTERTTNQLVTVQTQAQLTPTQLQAVEFSLLNSGQYGLLYQSQVQSVGPAIASSTTFWAIFAVFLASLAILAYITIAFRNVGSATQSFRYAACAIIALLHDAFVVLGVWSILGKLFPNDFKVDTLFVTAVLTVIGFSVHDTIVVFDRIRENMKRRTVETFTEIVNASLVQTMARSINTSLTVLLTLSALVLFGGSSIRSFTLALLIGIFSGTYSSIFNASMLLTVWETGEYRTWFRRTPATPAPPARNSQRLVRAPAR